MFFVIGCLGADFPHRCLGQRCAGVGLSSQRRDRPVETLAVAVRRARGVRRAAAAAVGGGADGLPGQLALAGGNRAAGGVPVFGALDAGGLLAHAGAERCTLRFLHPGGLCPGLRPGGSPPGKRTLTKEKGRSF